MVASFLLMRLGELGAGLAALAAAAPQQDRLR